MASFHIRKGPNKVSFAGLLQPLLDALKLLTKQGYTPLFRNKLIYNTTPSLVLLLSLIVWQFIPLFFRNSNHRIGLLWYLVIGRVMVFFRLLRGWSSNNKYSLIGILRGAATTIRYEATYIFVILLISLTFSTTNLKRFQYHLDPVNLIILPLIFICLLAEIHRTPFDFRERESELVRGYNTEYGGKNFAFLFLGEYSILLFNCILARLFVIGHTNPIWITILTLAFSVLFTNIRITLCRYRYDLLINLNWKLLLPLTLTTILITFPFLCVEHTVICYPSNWVNQLRIFFH